MREPTWGGPSQDLNAPLRIDRACCLFVGTVSITFVRPRRPTMAGLEGGAAVTR